MSKNMQQVLKTILISSLVSVNVLIWYGIFGTKFLIGIVLVGLIAVITADKEESGNVCR